MSEFLLEIYSEEIPARMQNKAVADFKNLFIDFFARENFKITESEIKAFIGPRRLVLLVPKIEKFQIMPALQKLGPKVDSNSNAIEGFLKSVGLKNIKDLQKIKNNKGEYYAFNTSESKVETSEILEKNLPNLLQKMSNLWQKNMRWEEDKNLSKWVRPIRSILAIFDGKIIDFEFGRIKSSNKTFGHNLLSKKSLKISNFSDYQEELSKNFVILNQEDRRKTIISGIEKICKKHQLKTVDILDEFNPLLNETVGLTEFPQIGLGQIEQEFMALPKEVLILTAKLHQKYFCLQDKKGKLAPYFIFVSNVKVTAKIIADNQKVLKARLSDAKFFIDEDLKVPFKDRLNSLKSVIFHESLGSVYEKVKRMEALNKLVAFFIPGVDLLLAEKLEDLAKNDLTTKCVAELPELQGMIGSYYAKIQGENSALSQAIYEQYLPLGPNSPLPKTPLGSLLAICDKIDTICGLFLVGQKPTSSKDPMALRRLALGIVRIIIAHNISIPLRIVVEKSIYNFPHVIVKNSHPDFSLGELKQVRKDAVLEVAEFIAQRIKSVLKDDYNIKVDIINALFDDYLPKIQNDKKFDINHLVQKAIFINNFVADKSNSNIIALYKRVVNIVSIEEKKDQRKYDSRPHLLTMRDKYEKILFKEIKKAELEVKSSFKVGNYEEVFKAFASLEKPLNDFFDNVKVNVEEDYLRHNRLLILGKIKSLFNSIFDFSKVEK